VVEEHVLLKLVCCLFNWLVLAGIVILAMDGKHYDVICAKKQGRFIINLKNTSLDKFSYFNRGKVRQNKILWY